MPIVLVKFFDNLFESCYIGLTELEQIFQIEDQNCEVAAPGQVTKVEVKGEFYIHISRSVRKQITLTTASTLQA